MFEKEDHCERELQSIRRQSIVKGKGQSIGLLCIMYYVLFFFFANLENCENFKSFGYIYIYIDDNMICFNYYFCGSRRF